MREVLIYTLAPKLGDIIEGFYTGENGCLPQKGDEVIVKRMDGSGITYPGTIYSTDEKTHAYSVQVTNQLVLL